jgi:hypothetical protein
MQLSLKIFLTTNSTTRVISSGSPQGELGYCPVLLRDRTPPLLVFCNLRQSGGRYDTAHLVADVGLLGVINAYDNIPLITRQ